MVDKIKNWLGAGSINLFGMPFTGKDTQGQALSKLLGANLIGGGEILRGKHTPQKIRKIMERGELVPVEDFIKIVVPNLKDARYAGKPLILSAVGRRRGEEEGILKAAELSGHPIKAVVFLKMKEPEIQKRWELAKLNGDRGERADDDVEALEVRVQEYKNKTLPVIDFYRGRGLLIKVDGSLSPDKVTNAILEKLTERASLGGA